MMLSLAPTPKTRLQPKPNQVMTIQITRNVANLDEDIAITPLYSCIMLFLIESKNSLLYITNGLIASFCNECN
jgi:hypothetical protein